MSTRASTGTQLRALLWEETRVGGSIAAACAAVGVTLLVSQRYYMGVESWRRDEFLAKFAGLGMPVLVALLLILSPNNAGHLEGGFSKRVLRLPIRTYLAVAASLAGRTVLVYLVSLMLVGLSSALFVDAPGLGAAVLIVMVYLAAQILDWLRAVLSGLTSLLALCAMALVGYALWPDTPELHPVARWMALAKGHPWIPPVAAVVGIVAAYAVSAIAVHEQRVGRRYGVPEIWEWPRRISFSRAYRATSFRSPMAAQVWFELRRAKWVLPFTTAIGALLFWGALWIAEDGFDREEGGTARLAHVTRYATMWGPALALLVAAGLHGMLTRVTGFRRRVRTAGYEYLQPLTDAQFAHARVLAGALMVIPTLVIAAAIHFAGGGRWTYVHTLADGLSMGMTSLREVAWVFLGRTLLIGVLAWMLLMVGTRLFRRTLAAVVLLGLLFLVAGTFIDGFFERDVTNRQIDVFAIVVVVVLTAVTLGLITHAALRSLAPRRTLLYWLGAWLLVAWLFRYALVTVWGADPMPWTEQALAALTALGAAAPVPLAYFATLLDVRRRRSPGPGSVDPAQHRSAPGRRSMIGAMSFVSIAVLVICLGWPAAPAYVEYRRDKGYPASLQELDAWYPEPPAGANAATQYLDVVNQQPMLDEKYVQEFNRIKQTFYPDRRHRGTGRAIAQGPFDGWEFVYIVGQGEWAEREPLDRRAWLATEFYWSRVTSTIAPKLQAIAQGDTTTARYPMDLERGAAVALPHLTQLRSLARLAALDALHWTIARQPGKAIDSIEAGFALSKSLTNEPLLISQLVRIAILGIASRSTETLLNRAELSDAELLRLQRICEEALPPVSEGLFLDRSMIAEGTFAANVAYLLDGTPTQPHATLRVLGPMLAYPAAASSMGSTQETEAILGASRLSWPEYQRWSDERDAYYEATLFFNPLIAIQFPAIGRAYDSEWRTRTMLDLTRVAVAVERYRLANRQLPAALADLVPRFLPEVPEDHFAGPGVPLKYRIRDDGSYVVYSVSWNMTDEGGEAVKKGNDWWNGDLRVTVAPLSFRMGPQVAAQ